MSLMSQAEPVHTRTDALALVAQEVFHQTREAVCAAHPETGEILETNPAFRQLFPTEQGGPRFLYEVCPDLPPPRPARNAQPLTESFRVRSSWMSRLRDLDVKRTTLVTPSGPWDIYFFRCKSEETLASRFLENALSSLPSAALVLDERNNVAALNSKFMELTLGKRADIEGKAPELLFHPLQPERLRAILADPLASTPPKGVQGVLRRLNGSLIPVRISVAPFPGGGRRVDVESELQAIEELVEAGRRLDEGAETAAQMGVASRRFTEEEVFPVDPRMKGAIYRDGASEPDLFEEDSSLGPEIKV